MKKKDLVLAYTAIAVGLTLTACNTDTEVEETTETATEVTTEEETSSKKTTETTETDDKKTTTEESSKKTTEEGTEKSTEASSNKQTTTQGSTTQQSTTQSTTTQNTSSNTTQTSAQSTTQSTTTPQTTSTDTSTNTSSQETSSPATTHTHNWVPITEQVYCPEEVRYEDVEVDDYQVHTCCNGCGFDFTANGGVSKYYDDPQYGGCPVCGSGGYSDRQVYCGKKTVNMPVEYIPAHTEERIIGYKCSECGATK